VIRLAFAASLAIKFKPLGVVMELNAIYRCVAALDVHQANLTVCILFETDTGEVVCQLREFGGFKRDRRKMASWVSSFQPELVVMENTGIYWKSPFAALEWYGLNLAVVNACQSACKTIQDPGENSVENCPPQAV
jgi:hypothetical protein